jgi:RNA polymerase sigma-70 factor (ECF subfamily)
MPMDSSQRELQVDAVLAAVAQPVLRYLERYVGDRALAEDLRQETLARVAQGLPAFAGRSSIRTWAFSIASRVAADHFRRPDQRARIVDLDEAEEPADPERDVDERMAVDEMNRCVRQVIDSLPESYRAALILHDLEELSLEQTAEACACTLATAKIRVHRARQRLREALKKECDFYRDGEGVYRCDRKA